MKKAEKEARRKQKEEGVTKRTGQIKWLFRLFVQPKELNKLRSTLKFPLITIVRHSAKRTPEHIPLPP
jgi:hypothetical protein